MKIIFAGTPDFAASHLSALIAEGCEIVAVYTQPDRPTGRGKKLIPGPVKQLAELKQIKVMQPISLKNEEDREALKAFNADIMIVVAYGLLLPQAVLDLFPRACINVHASLLPRWRGAAPIQRAIEAGDKRSGVTIMQIELALDAGDMLYKTECDILSDDTGESLHDRLAEIGPPALLKALALLENNKLKPEKQNEDAVTYANKLSKIEANIDWLQSADEIERKIRAFNSWPVAYSYLNGECIRVWDAKKTTSNAKIAPGTIIENDKKFITVKCGEEAITLLKIQIPGGKALPVQAILNGNKVDLAIGQSFSKKV